MTTHTEARESGETGLSTINSGYIGSPEKWHQYLQCISQSGYLQEIDTRTPLLLANEVFSTKKYDAQIRESELKLGLSLPKSYKDFIMAGGLEYINGLFNSHIRKFVPDYPPRDFFYAPNKIGRFKDISSDIYQENIKYKNTKLSSESDDNYYLYNSYEKDRYTGAGSVFYKLKNLNFLEIGLWSEAPNGIDVYGLVDTEVTKDGEYEAWSYNPRHPGAYRYRSFAEFLIFSRMVEVMSAEETITEFDMFNSLCTQLILDTKVLREQWKPQ